jgi:4-alpha-glucanotransferase
VIPVQDVLGLDSDARMNVPSQTAGNWSWRLRRGALTSPLAEKLAALVEITDRDECVKQPSAHAEKSDGKVSDDFAA